jgi:membrane protein DedA with SNARE-associated domain
MFSAIISWIVTTIGQLGYTGIVCLMFLESSFFPFPSEVVIPPAGYLASTGRMEFFPVIIAGILGSLLGALFNYWLSLKVGRPFFIKYGRYLMISRRTLEKAEKFFKKHGHISTFIGRLLPGVRQYISLPAGIARMDLAQFCLFTALGSGIWVTVLAVLGYMVGENADLINGYLHKITIVLALLCFAVAAGYFLLRKRKETGKDRTS